MSEWWLKYLGRPWAAVPNPPASYTCGELLRAVYRDEFGVDTAHILADPLVLRDCVAAMVPERHGLYPLQPGQAPIEFDAVFMARVKYDNHVGIAAQTTEGLMVLHCMQGAGVVLESPGELAGRGFRRLHWYRQRGLEHD